jgi:hypothetical protein
LAEAGRIGGAELAAGIAWRGWVESIGRVWVQAWVARTRASLIPRMPGDRQLAAASRLRAAALALGEDRTRLLFWVLVDDLSWVELGARILLSDKTTKDRCAEALSALASWLAGQPVPDPPRRWRYRRVGSR